jgi:DNA-binding CsgD family transcriptional regulator
MGKIVKGSEELLSSRERNMVKLVRAGLRNREIAEKLGVTEGTVKVYLNRIYKKTGARNRTELAVRAAEWGTSSWRIGARLLRARRLDPGAGQADVVEALIRAPVAGVDRTVFRPIRGAGARRPW